MQEARHNLDARKSEIGKEVLRLFSLVKQAMSQSAQCLGGQDAQVCKAVVETDPEINDAEHRIEQDCLLAIALHQPVARDLREIVAATRIAGELERIGDYAADSAGIVLQMDGSDLSAAGVAGVLEVSGLCVQMLDEVMAAYLHEDAARARQAARLDDEIDSRHARLVKTLFGAMQSSPALVPDASRMLWISHNLERCADRATNIAEQVVFMLEAQAVELD